MIHFSLSLLIPSSGACVFFFLHCFRFAFIAIRGPDFLNVQGTKLWLKVYRRSHSLVNSCVRSEAASLRTNILLFFFLSSDPSCSLYRTMTSSRSEIIDFTQQSLFLTHSLSLSLSPFISFSRCCIIKNNLKKITNKNVER